MPNWCENEVTISGPRELVDTVVSRLDSADHHGNERAFNFDAIIPYPDEYKGAGSESVYQAWLARNTPESRVTGWRPDGYNMGGYEWCIKHWGTKWNAHEVIRTDKPSKNPHRRTVHYRFDTAWLPPVPVLEKLAAAYPDLRFELKYWEGGMGFKGVSRYREGTCVHEETTEYRGRRGG